MEAPSKEGKCKCERKAESMESTSENEQQLILGVRGSSLGGREKSSSEPVNVCPSGGFGASLIV